MAVRRLPRALRRIFHKAKGQPYRFTNSYRGLKRARRHGYRRIDWDATVTKDGVVVINHWPKFAKDRFKDPSHAWPKSTKIAQLTYAEVKRLKAPGGYRIRSAGQRFWQAKRAGIDVMLEVKGQREFEDPELMARVWRANVAAGEPVEAVMTLQNLGNPLARLKAAKAAGFKTVLLARGPKPANWDENWAPHVDYVRGNFRGGPTR